MTSFLGFRSLSDVLGLGRRPILREFAIKNTTNKQVNRHLTTNPGIRKGKPSSQDDCYRYRLCQKCDDFLKWDKLRLRRVEENTFFHHYTKSSDLKASAAKRCHLCLLIYDHLLKSRRPEGETELPERQVRLTIKYPDFASGALFLNASIKPADLSTAGLHDLEQVDYHKVTKILLPDFDEYIRDLFPLGAAMEVLDVETLVVVQDLASERAKYFQSGMEISADEFYALALPFHTCDLQLHTVFPGLHFDWLLREI
jgi:hypothetical protein